MDPQGNAVESNQNKIIICCGDVSGPTAELTSLKTQSRLKRTTSSATHTNASHLWNISGYSIKDGHIQHAGDGLVCPQAPVVPTEQFSGCGANKSVTKTIIKWKLLKVFNNYCESVISQCCFGKRQVISVQNIWL